MIYQFTDGVRRVLGLAREESGRLGHDHLGVGHILLALLMESEGTSVAVLSSLDADTAAVTRELESRLEAGTSDVPLGEIPYTHQGKQALENSMREARDFGHAYVGTEHLLLGLLHDGTTLAAEVLASFGVTLEAARKATADELGEPVPLPSDEPTPRPTPIGQATPDRLGTDPIQVVVVPGAATPDDLAELHSAIAGVYHARGDYAAPGGVDGSGLVAALDRFELAEDNLRAKGGRLILLAERR